MSALPKQQATLFVVHRSSEFDEWWMAYPRKIAKGAAEKAFVRARKLASLSELIEGVRRYIASKPARIDFCHPATWLNGQRWLDEGVDEHEPVPALPTTRPALDPAENERRAQEWMRRLRAVLEDDPFPAFATARDFAAWYRRPKSSAEIAALRAAGWFGDAPIAMEDAAALWLYSRLPEDPIRAVLRELGVTATERI